MPAKIIPLVLLAIACTAWVSAHGAGLKPLELPATADAPQLSGAVWSPCAAATSGSVSLRQIVVEGIRDCPVHGTSLPLIVFSHGARGWFGGHHDTASALADAGFVVAAVTHQDKSPNWQTERPAAIKRLIDYMLGNWPNRSRLDGERIGFFGFSRGGYTGLVLLGAEPDFGRMISHCQKVPADVLCQFAFQSSANVAAAREQSPRVKGMYVHDSRIQAAVIAAPLGLVFSPKALKQIQVPMQLWRPEIDELVIYPYNAQAIYDGLLEKPDYRVVPGASHFAILAPCTEQQAQTVSALCRDAENFDRFAFHEQFNEQVIEFFGQKLESSRAN